MNALLAQFIPEARDLLEQAGAGMLALERSANSPTVINDVFRAVHTLKGSSGLFDVAPLTRLVHAAEDLLGEVRTGDLALNSDIVDRLLDSLDLVGRWIDSLEACEQLPNDAEAAMRERVSVLQRWLVEAPAASVAKSRTASDLAPGWLAHLPETDRLLAFAAVAGRRLLAWTFVPEEDCFFRGDDPIAMLQHSPGILAVRATPREPFPPFDALDPLVCQLRFEVLSDASREALEEHMRYVAESVDIHDIAASDLSIPMGSRAKSPVFRDFAELARRHIGQSDQAALDRSIAAILNMIAPESIQASALRWCNAWLAVSALDNSNEIERLIGVVETGAAAPKTTESNSRSDAELSADARLVIDKANVDLARKIALEQVKVLETPADPGTTQSRLGSVGRVLQNLLLAVGGASAADADAAVAASSRSGDLESLRIFASALGSNGKAIKQIERVESPTSAPDPAVPAPIVAERPSDNKAIPRVLRVDQSKIDSIMNLVAELIVAKNGLSYLATRAERVHGSRAMAREVKDLFAVVDRITQGLQVGVMSVRMMPVSQVFQRFPRLVRDISRKLGKNIELIIEGEDTEADKNVLESLADPLIHMVRNSLDHGIETPQVRVAAGKPETGVLRITARHENDFVVIEVTDDGKGIDPNRVRAKALQQGLVTADRAEHMSDQEAANLVFMAGFSTNDEVSDLSGRGVGMDVVRTTVLKAGGDVSLRSTLGVGSVVTVRLPLTMAVTRIVTIDCRGRIFGIPMDSVVETVKVARERIHRFKDVETFVLRDAIVPIFRLARSLGLPEQAERREDDEAVMVVRVGQDRIGVVVDGFRERLEVIVKPLEGLLEGMPGFSGTALLGDGQVLLILDLKEML